jgi:predicted Zn-dependent protease
MLELGRRSREAVLAFSLIALAACFAITGIGSRYYHHQQESMAQQWFQRGDAELTAGHATTAVDDFGNALVYARDNDLFELRLAEALIAAGRAPEAQAHLEELWARTPSSGIVNLELARLVAERGDVNDAVRYYNNAIYGLWGGEANGQGRRRDAEFELYSFLMENGQSAAAEVELLAIAAGLPSSPTLHVRVAKIMLGNGDYRHALSEFSSALAVDHTDSDALAGAGEAAFQLGDYSAAVRYLEQATRSKTTDPVAREHLETSQALLSLDPLEPRLGVGEGAERSSSALTFAIARLDACIRLKTQNPAASPPGDLEDIYLQMRKMRAQKSVDYLRRHPEEIGSLMDLISTAETVALKNCGEPSEPSDRALLLIARRREGSQ